MHYAGTRLYRCASIIRRVDWYENRGEATNVASNLARVMLSSARSTNGTRTIFRTRCTSPHLIVSSAPPRDLHNSFN